ncbi:Alpha/Beta hydrolase protein [Desarmillaria tabescens]|uniref:Alpha/Beta hydrolase protein n=1 Tax=Armillaria tabescens TaxID=1929756 RepID=A0AA39N5C1_ARMTA|nr:Alpha/Beta hydrolase protein [Desarmillaria tabescens]KAK0458013.1 Alpha/Beta hydrolase protein [Desarmillaria tabescens]
MDSSQMEILPQKTGLYRERSIRFNCVAVDIRLHGITTNDPLPEGYSAQDTAEDVALFMLPACHIVGLSMGSMVAISLAVYYPNQVASLFLVSPLGLEEPADVADGRREIAENWREAFKTGEPDMAAISDSVYGAHQLGFSDNLNDFVNVLTNILIPPALKNSVPGFFEHFLGYAPVKSIHCLGSIAYPQEYSEIFMQQLKDAAVNVGMATIPEAPHFGVVTHGDIVNQLHAFIIDSCRTSVPPAPQEVSSP